MAISAKRLPAWVVVAGTGHSIRMSRSATLAAQELGAVLADRGCGLVTGGWHGVDEVLTAAFVERCRSLSIDPNERIVQVIQEDWNAPLRVGQLVRAPAGAEEWLGQLTYGDAVILIGGFGGTYHTFLGALHRGLPRFPIRSTGGDAERAFDQMVELWELLPNPAMTADQFQSLRGPIDNVADAQKLTGQLVDLLLTSVSATRMQKGPSEQPVEVLIGHIAEDREWMERLRKVLRPLERKNILRSWATADVPPGEDLASTVGAKIESCQIAVLLISMELLGSDNDPVATGLPRLMERAAKKEIQLLWVPVNPFLLEATDLASLKPATDVNQPLEGMNDAQAQVAIVDVARQVMSAAATSPRGRLA